MGLSWVDRAGTGPGPAGRGSEPMGKADGDRGQIAVFLLDDHEIVRRGVHDLLEAEPDITVIGEAGTAGAALAPVPPPQPHGGGLGGGPPGGPRGGGGPGGPAGRAHTGRPVRPPPPAAARPLAPTM